MSFAITTKGGPNDGDTAAEGFSTRDRAEKMLGYVNAWAAEDLAADGATLVVEERDDVPAMSADDEQKALSTASLFALASQEVDAG